MMRIAAILLATTLLAATSTGLQPTFYPPRNNAPRCADPTVQNMTLYYDMLEASTQMPAQVLTLRVGVPFPTLVKFFNHPSYWPIWDHLFGTNFVRNYTLCAHFDNVSYTNPPPVQGGFPKGMTAPHWIDQHGFSADYSSYAFGWIFQLIAADGTQLIFGRHTFSIRPYVDESGLSATTVQSFEKAAGSQLNNPVNAIAWTSALQQSATDQATGFQCLELMYTMFGDITIDKVTQYCAPKK